MHVRDLALVAALALPVGGCSGATVSSAAAPSGRPIASSPPIVTSASPLLGVPTPAASAAVFQSTVYPYAWALPVGVAHRSWHPADRPWRTDERIDSIAPYDDSNGTPDGGLFILGAPWPGTLAGFDTLIRADVARFHGCKAPDEVREIHVAGEPAVSFRQLCGNGVYAARVILLHRGFGLVVNLSEMAASRFPVVLDDVEAWLAGFSWTNP